MKVLNNYARFKLEVYSGGDDSTDYEAEVLKFADESPFIEEIQWYNIEYDMKSMSKLHPKAVFKLNSEGEYFKDTWVAYFHNGKMQMCEPKVVYDDFDKSKLK